MRYRVTFAAGFAVGFITGARAGRERYEQIKQTARRVMDNPAVQQAAGALSAQANELSQTARQKVTGKLHEKVPGLRDKVPGLGGDAAGNGEVYFPASGAQGGPSSQQ